MTETMEDIMKKKRELVAAKNKVMGSQRIEPNRNLMPFTLPENERPEGKSGHIPGIATLPPKKRRKNHYAWN
jgi:hypothetical protein